MSFGLNPGIKNTGTTDFSCDNLGLLVETSINSVSLVGILSLRQCNSSLDSGKIFVIILLICW